ncbi:MAG TPA: serine kinase [Rhizobiaceae bacterium]|nr:serine kinase [Rhizobiaceae bacterium]
MTVLATIAAATSANGSPVVPLPYAYRAFGLEIHSDLELPELPPSDSGQPDIAIRIGKFDRAVPGTAGGSYHEFSDEDRFLAWSAVGKFLITGGTQIDIEPADGVDPRLIAFPLLGPVMALLLHDRGQFVLHASAVSVNGVAAAFLGDKGAGKSTTAAAMLAAGHKLVTDDVLAIEVRGDGDCRIEPAFPQVKLAADAAIRIPLAEAEILPTVHPAIEKRLHKLTGEFPESAQSIRRIYVLKRGSEARITALPSADALSALFRFSYVLRFGRQGLLGGASRHLEQASHLVRNVGVSILEVPDNLGRLPEVVDLVARNLACGDRS